MSHRIVVITGATGGLGQAVVDAFGNAGDTVVAVSRSASEFSADLTDPIQAEDTLRRILDRHQRIDVLVHVLGGFSSGGDVSTTSLATWERMMNVNFHAALYVFRSVLPPMLEAKRGRLIAVGARTGVQPTAGLGAYGVSKAALNALVQTIALEVKDSGVTANVVLPGTIKTETNVASARPEEAAAWVEPASIAEVILWLASDAAADVNGALLPVYGRS